MQKIKAVLLNVIADEGAKVHDEKHQSANLNHIVIL